MKRHRHQIILDDSSDLLEEPAAQNRRTQQTTTSHTRQHRFEVRSVAPKKYEALDEAIAHARFPILVHGPSGSGKTYAIRTALTKHGLIPRDYPASHGIPGRPLSNKVILLATVSSSHELSFFSEARAIIETTLDFVDAPGFTTIHFTPPTAHQMASLGFSGFTGNLFSVFFGISQSEERVSLFRFLGRIFYKRLSLRDIDVSKGFVTVLQSESRDFYKSQAGSLKETATPRNSQITAKTRPKRPTKEETRAEVLQTITSNEHAQAFKENCPCKPKKPYKIDKRKIRARKTICTFSSEDSSTEETHTPEITEATPTFLNTNQTKETPKEEKTRHRSSASQDEIDFLLETPSEDFNEATPNRISTFNIELPPTQQPITSFSQALLTSFLHENIPLFSSLATLPLFTELLSGSEESEGAWLALLSCLCKHAERPVKGGRIVFRKGS